MRLLVAVLFLTQAAANSDDVTMMCPKSVNPETFMNVVSQKKIGYPLCLNVC